MTILEPNKHEHVNRIFWGMVTLLLVVTGGSIFFYNETVQLHHALRGAEQAYASAMTKNAELKNDRFAMTDGKALKKIAESRGLIKVKNPEYIKVKKELLARAL